MVIAELAVVTFVDDSMMIGRCELRDHTLILINPVQERVERRTEVEAAAAAVADIVDPQCFLFEGSLIDRLEKTKFYHERDLYDASRWGADIRVRRNAPPHPVIMRSGPAKAGTVTASSYRGLW